MKKHDATSPRHGRCGAEPLWAPDGLGWVHAPPRPSSLLLSPTDSITRHHHLQDWVTSQRCGGKGSGTRRGFECWAIPRHFFVLDSSGKKQREEKPCVCSGSQMRLDQGGGEPAREGGSQEGIPCPCGIAGRRCAVAGFFGGSFQRLGAILPIRR